MRTPRGVFTQTHTPRPPLILLANLNSLELVPFLVLCVQKHLFFVQHSLHFAALVNKPLLGLVLLLQKL